MRRHTGTITALGGCLALATAGAQATPSPAKPAVTMNDLRDHFSACFQPPHEAAGSRVTFYFSLNTSGQVLGPPRATWIGFKGSQDERERRLAGFKSAFDKCLPLAMDPALAATIPGKVYYLQYVMADTGQTSQVLLRPFGSHYYDGGGYQTPLEPGPLLPQRIGPPAFVPSRARFFRPPARLFRPLFPRFPILLRRPVPGTAPIGHPLPAARR